MRNRLVVCAAFVATFISAAVSVSASQGALGQATADRDRVEALRHYRLGQDSMRSEHYDEAEREFQTASKLDPSLELAPYGLGQVYMATKRFRLAIVAYGKCRDVIHGNAVAAAGDELAYQRRINDSITALEDEMRLYSQPGKNGTSPAAINNQRTLGMRIQALKDAKNRAIGSAEPTPAWLSLALGSAYFRTDAMADAEREYRAAIDVDPKLGEAHSNLAVVCMLSARYAEADTEVKAAEKAGFRVNPQLKEDLKKALPDRK
jgi:tetratricopeptide (TPR) repeat protein